MPAVSVIFRSFRELEQDATVTMDGVIGHERLKEYIALVGHLMKNSERAKKLNLNPFENVLLYGPPGSGKTKMVEVVAKSLGLPCMMVSAASFIGPLRGLGGKAVLEFFRKARSSGQPVVVGIDEIEIMAGDRGKTDGNTNDTLNQLLTELTNKENAEILCIGMTNRLEDIDPAAIRPGRFNVLINVPYPDAVRRIKAFELYISKVLGAGNDGHIDYDTISNMTNAMSYAAIEVIVSNASKQAFRGDELLDTKHLIKAIIDMKAGAVASDSSASPKMFNRFINHLVGHVIGYAVAPELFVCAIGVCNEDDIRTCSPTIVHDAITGVRDSLVQMFSVFLANEADCRLMSTSSSLFVKFDLPRLLLLTQEVLAMLGASIGYSAPEVTAAAMRVISRSLRASAKEFYEEHTTLVDDVRVKLINQVYMSKDDLIEIITNYAARKNMTYSEMSRLLSKQFNEIARSLVQNINMTVRSYLVTPKMLAKKQSQELSSVSRSASYDNESVSDNDSDSSNVSDGITNNSASASDQYDTNNNSTNDNNTFNSSHDLHADDREDNDNSDRQEEDN